MKVLLVNDYATPTGGAELQMLRLREALRERGHDARLFASSAGGGDPDYRCFGTTSRFRTLLQTANPSARVRLARVLRAFRPDVVHVRLFLTQLSPLILPLLRRVPSIYHVVWYRPICPIGTKLLPDGSECLVPAGVACYRYGCVPARDWVPLMIQLRLFRRWSGAFDRVIALSEPLADRLAEYELETHGSFPNPVRARPPRPRLPPGPTVGFAGRLTREKGVDVLLRAFARVVRSIPEARLLIAGEGPARDGLVRLSGELGLNGHASFVGHIAHEKLDSVLADAWVQVVPSRWSEPFGNVAAEAMMRGTAVVASSTGGLARLVRDGENGYLVAPNDVEQLAEVVGRLLRDRELCEQLGRRGRQLAERTLAESSYLTRLEGLYDAVARAS